MKGYVYIDKEFASNRKLVGELLSSACFKDSDYGMRMNISKQELQDRWVSLAYEIDSDDPIMIFASVLHSQGRSPLDVSFDGDVDYNNVKKIKANEDTKLKSIFCLPENVNTDIDRKYGVGVVKSTDESILKLLPNLPIASGARVSWDSILPKDYWNSIVIADCFILRDKKTIETNLVPILDKGYCSISANVQMHITIFTQFYNKDGDPTMWKGAYEFLKSKYAKANIEIVDVKHANKEIHDREILTNNYYVHIPGGTDVINSSGCANRRTTIIPYRYPQFLENAKADYDMFCKSILRYREDYLAIKCDEKKPFKNRLIYS